MNFSLMRRTHSVIVSVALCCFMIAVVVRGADGTFVRVGKGDVALYVTLPGLKKLVKNPSGKLNVHYEAYRMVITYYGMIQACKVPSVADGSPEVVYIKEWFLGNDTTAGTGYNDPLPVLPAREDDPRSKKLYETCVNNARDRTAETPGGKEKKRERKTENRKRKQTEEPNRLDMSFEINLPLGFPPIPEEKRLPSVSLDPKESPALLPGALVQVRSGRNRRTGMVLEWMQERKKWKVELFADNENEIEASLQDPTSLCLLQGSKGPVFVKRDTD